jgi:hypothetical protein
MKLGSLHLLLVAAVLACVCAGATARADELASKKYPLLAAYIYNFTQFTTWPDGAIGDTFRVCVVGDNPFGSALEPMKSRTVQGKKIIVRHSNHDDGGLSSCNILFVAPSEHENAKGIIASLKDAPVLTMSEGGGFSAKGGMIEFTPEDGKIGISIGLSAVKAAGLSISSKLLALSNVRG